MAVLTYSWMMDLLLSTSALLGLLYWFLTRTSSYFRDRGIPYLKPIPAVGLLDIYTKSQMDLALSLYNKFPGERFFGYFQSRMPTYLVKDPDLVRQIMVKDFAHFYDRGFPNIKGDFLSKNLFHLKGQTWRSLRNKLSPTFSSGKLKLMFSQFVDSAEHMLGEVKELSRSGTAREAKQLSTNFTLEVIASSAFGLDLGKDNPQTEKFNQRVGTAFISGAYQVFVLFLTLFVPNLLDVLGVSHYTSGAPEYFLNLIKSTKAYRKTNKVERNDYFQLLMTLQECDESGKSMTVDTNEEDELINQMEFATSSSLDQMHTTSLTDESMTAQAFVFLVAGTDSVSSTLSFALYHIAKDPEIQRRLTEEIQSAVDKHGWTYQAVRAMTYLDQILQETLRLYPILPLTLRQCTIPYRIPDTDVVIEKGAVVAVSVAGLHRDPKYFPDPDLFNPDRFKDNNHKPHPTYLPFGDGPRICIGMRFALVEMKLFLAKILAQYSVHVNNKTVEPFVFDSNSFSPKPKSGIWISYTKRNDQLQ